MKLMFPTGLRSTGNSSSPWGICPGKPCLMTVITGFSSGHLHEECKITIDLIKIIPCFRFL